MDFFSFVYDVLKLLLFMGVFIWIVKFLQNTKRYPKFTQIDLPEKIYPSRTENGQSGVGTFVLNVATFGGHGTLKKAIYNYESAYIDYARCFNQYIDHLSETNNKINQLGQITCDIFYEIEKAKKLVGKRLSDNTIDNNISIINQRFQKIDLLIYQSQQNSTTGTALLQGVGVGGLAAVGSWVIVSLVGTASTGTAIASLSGAAAYNATLAWFGGGALAAGGGGMATGTVVLGAIVAIPVLAFSTYKTYSKAQEVEQLTKDIYLARSDILQKQNLLKNMLIETNKHIELMDSYYQKLSLVNKKLEKLIYPEGIKSKIQRTIADFFDSDFYSFDEVQEIADITQLIDEIYALFLRENHHNNLITIK